MLRLLAGLALVVAGGAAEPAVITDPAMIWAMPTEQKSLRHPLRIEGRVNYFETGFKLFWLEKAGVSTYVQVSANPPPLRNGQYVVIEGAIVPTRGLDADGVTVRVVREHDPVVPLETHGRINAQAEFAGRIVAVEAYVDSQQTIDDEHERMILIADNRPVICWVRPDNPARVPDWRNQWIRATGVYSSRFDPTMTRTTIELWVGSQADIKVHGPLATSLRFRRAPTPVGEIHRQPPGTELLIRGRVERHEPGEYLVIRDPTGEVQVESIQSNRLVPGTEVEAVGRVEETDRWILRDALYRQVAVRSAAPAPAAGPLVRIADIRALGRTEAAAGRPVDITGMVTWSMPGSDFLFLQDATGGLRVHYDRTKTGEIAYGKYFNIKGVTRAGPISPAVELHTYVDLGSMSHPRTRPITMERALTGQHDGEWVELRGFLRRTESEGDWRWIYVTTPAGEFVGHLQSPVNFVANPGALISVRGVCDLRTDGAGRVTGVTLRVPFLHDIRIEQDAPADYYDLPRRELEDLDRLGVARELMRVRVTGTVLHAVPGRRLYLQEGAAGLFVLSGETAPLRPGDRVEAVGILGREGGRTILREAVYRRTGTGPPPAPASLPDITAFNPANDHRLMRVRGVLLDTFHSARQTRLTLEQGGISFEASLDHEAGRLPPGVETGAVLELTGIYRVMFDDAQQARGFELLVRDPADIALVRPAPLLNLRRVLYLTAALGGCVLLGLAWIHSLRRRVRAQTDQIRAQLEQQARIEAGMQQAARLESLGVLAGGIAHDFNNLLTVIMGNVSLMKLNPAVAAGEAKALGAIERGTARARDLARQLLTFASGGEPMREPADLAAAAREAAARTLRGTAVRLELTAEPGLWPADGDRDQLTQAVCNLLQNAAEAMPRGGTVRLRLANEETPAGRGVRLTVADEGGGIAPEVLPKVFDPYFTTRKGARGLGLAMVYSIVHRHGGRIEASSPPGQGAVFSLWLPAAARPAAAEEPPPPPPPAASATGAPRVLLMEDEPGVAEVATAVLQRMGLDPQTVPDGATALREFEAARAAARPFALVILDLTIPGGMGGRETIEAIRRIDPETPAIVSSGYSSDPVMANFRAHGFQAVVPKPYDVATLADAVSKLVPVARRP
ncbi:MAG: hybrid sensor histidine kinase/response regulator [Verrucomicrobiota bacterium]